MKTPAFNLLSKFLLLILTIHTLTGCKKPDVTFSISPEGPVLMGESVTLDWAVTTLPFASSFSVSITTDTGVEIGEVGKSGSQEVELIETTEFTLTATQVVLGQSYTATVPVSVEVIPIDPPQILDFNFQQPDVRGGSEVVLNWLVEGIVQELTLTPNHGSLNVDDLGATVRPVENTTYILTASNAAGSAEAQLDIEVSLTEIEQVSFSDPNLAECFDEMVAELNIQYVEEVFVLECPSRQIFDTWGIDGLLNLETLDLSDNRIQHIHGGSQFRYLSHVNLSNNLIEDLFIFIDPSMNYLKSLKVGNNPIADVDGLLALVGASTELEALDLSGLPLFMRYQSLNLPESLRYLDLTATGITLLPRLPSGLVELYAGSNRLTYAEWIPVTSNLTHLDLSHNLLGHGSSSWFGGLSELRYLDLSGNSGFDLNSLSSDLANLDNLQHLGIGGLCLTNGLSSLGDFMMAEDPQQPSQLTSINLENTCLRHISELSHHPLLTDVNVANNPIEYLGVALDWENLKAIDVSHTRIDNINELFLGSRLERLGLSGLTQISLQDITQLVQANEATLTHISLADLNARWVTRDNGDTGSGDSIYLPQSSSLIEQLDVSGNRLTMLDLTNYPNIRELDVSNNPELAGELFFESPSLLESINVSNTLTFVAFASWDSMPKLRDIKAINVLDRVLSDIHSSLQYLRAVRSLHLSNVSDLASLGLDSMQRENLRDLSLPNINLRMAGDIMEFRQLESLDISGGIQEALDSIPYAPLKKFVAANVGLRNLPNLDDFQFLEHLDLSGNDQILGWEIGALSPFGLNHLSYLDLSGIPFPFFEDLNVLDFRDCDRWDQLRTLIMDNSQLKELPAYCLESLEYLSLRNNSLEFAPYMELSVLRHLDLAHNEIRHFNVNDLWHLEHLDISYNPVVQTFDVQSFINTHPQLTGLGIGGKLDGVRDLSFSPTQYQRMKFLDFSDTGLEILPADLFQMEAIEVLNLSGNRLFDFYAWTSNLKELNLSGNPVTHIQLDTSTANELLVVLDVSNTLLNRNNQFEQWLSTNGHRLLGLSLSGLEFDNPNILSSFQPVSWEIGYPLQTLDVSNSNLQLDELYHFSQLTELNVSGLPNPVVIVPEVGDELKVLVANNVEIDLYGLSGFDSPLNTLSLNYAQFDYREVSSVDDMPKLSRIALAGIEQGYITNSILRENNRWRALDFSNTGWLNHSELNNQEGLTELRLKGNGIQTMDWVNSFRGLEILDLSDNTLTEIPGIALSPNLKSLNLSGSQVEVTSSFIDRWEISYLEELRLAGATMAPGTQWHFDPVNRLRILDLTDVALGDELPTHTLEMIEELYLNNTGISNLQLPYNDYSRVTTLELNDNNLFDLSIPFTESLRTLKIARNPLIDISSLLQFQLDTREIEVLDVSGYSSLISLDFLNGSVLALQDFSMADTQVTSLGPLFDAQELTQLDISNAPVNCHDVDMIQQMKPELVLVGGQGCENPGPTP